MSQGKQVTCSRDVEMGGRRSAKQTLGLAAWLDRLDTVLTRLSSTSHGPDQRLCCFSSPSPFDSNRHAEIDHGHSHSCLCYFCGVSFLGLSFIYFFKSLLLLFTLSHLLHYTTLHAHTHAHAHTLLSLLPLLVPPRHAGHIATLSFPWRLIPKCSAN